MSSLAASFDCQRATIYQLHDKPQLSPHWRSVYSINQSIRVLVSKRRRSYRLPPITYLYEPEAHVWHTWHWNNTVTCDFGFLFEGANSIREIATMQVSKSAVFKMFSIHSKTQSRRFEITLLWRAFSKSSVFVWTVSLTLVSYVFKFSGVLCTGPKC